MLAGVGCLSDVRHIYGFSSSSAAVAHVFFGWLIFYLFIVMIVLGGIRPVDMGVRNMCINVHSIVGFFIYAGCCTFSHLGPWFEYGCKSFQFLFCLIFSVFLCINSTYIPGSPSRTIDAVRVLGKEMDSANDYVSEILFVGWIFVDIAFHIFFIVRPNIIFF